MPAHFAYGEVDTNSQKGMATTMKKVISILLCILILGGCVSCTASDSTDTSDDTRPPRQVDHIKRPDETSAEETTDAQTAAAETKAETTAPDTETEAPAPNAEPQDSTVRQPDTVIIPSEPQTEPQQPEPAAPRSPEDILNSMTLEEMVGQMFLARHPSSGAAGDIETYHLGGYILFARDFEYETPASIKAKLDGYQSAAKIPMLFAVDEEGGTVTRVSRFTAFRSSPFLSPRELYAAGGINSIQQTEREKDRLLRSIGLNVNVAPVCDMTTDPNAFMYKRSLGQNAQVTSDFVRTVLAEAAAQKIGCVMKHFPGYGNNTDTHVGIATDTRTKEELIHGDLIPFQAGINAGADAILVSHTFITAVDPAMPATLSAPVHDMLRSEMGFGGVIVTDDLSMQAVASIYGAGDAAILAVLAGNDLLCCTEYKTQYNAVLNAAKNGQIQRETIRSSVLRILRWKEKLRLLD